MLIDLKLDGKIIVTVGGGLEGYRKTQCFVDNGATIWVISREFSRDMQELAETKKISLLKTEIQDAKTFIDSLNPKPNILLAVTDDSKLNAELVKEAKKTGSMVYSVDNPAISDFILPAVAKVGDVKIAISTSGRSPAMAKTLRERIEKIITPEDLLEIQLQSRIRSFLKERVPDPKIRSKMLYDILSDERIKQVLKQGKLSEAQKIAIILLQEREAK